MLGITVILGVTFILGIRLIFGIIAILVITVILSTTVLLDLINFVREIGLETNCSLTIFYQVCPKVCFVSPYF